MQDKNTIDRHHLLEIILWPNGDGTFKTILNSKERLKKLGIYDDFKMTIPLTHSEHTRLHNKTRTGERHPFYGKIHSDETRKKMSTTRKGRTRSAETIKKISETMKGHAVSDETRKKISAARKAMLGTSKSK